MMRLMRFAAVFLFMAVAYTLFSDEKAAATTPIETELGKTLERLKIVSPVIYEKVRACPHDKQLRVMLRALGIDIQTSIPAVPEIIPFPKAYPAKIIFKNTLFYARLDALDAEQLQQLKEDITASARLQSPPKMAILDLRNTGVTAKADVFPEILEYLKGLAKSKCPVLRCCAILTSQETAPKAQLLACILQKHGIGFVVGQRSRYCMHPMEKLDLEGECVYVPVIQDEKYFCLRADVLEVKAMPMIAYENIGKVKGYDTAINYARDCLVAVSILSGGMD